MSTQKFPRVINRETRKMIEIPDVVGISFSMETKGINAVLIRINERYYILQYIRNNKPHYTLCTTKSVHERLRSGYYKIRTPGGW
jgi:hypothetical protein